jgi:hypothetical protein
MSISSQYSQITKGILIEYIYTDVHDPDLVSINDFQVELLQNDYTNTKYFFNDPVSDNFNIRDYSATYIQEGRYVYLNRNLPMQYIDLDPNLTNSIDLLVTDFHNNYEIAYDTIKIHFANNFNFTGNDGFIFDIKVTRRDDVGINLASLVYRTLDDIAVINPSPLLISETLYNKYIEFKIPSIYFLLLEDKSSNNLTNKFTAGQGFVSYSKINITLLGIIKTEKLNSFTYFNTNTLSKISFNYKDAFEPLVARIQESTEGEFYELYGEYNGEIYANFINDLNNKSGNDYIVFHEIILNEQLGTQFFETTHQITVQTSDFDKPFKFRPVIEYAASAVSYTITYILRLINRTDNLQSVKTSQITSYDTKKYGKSLKRLFYPSQVVIDKIYNKIENTSFSNIKSNVDDQLMTATLTKTEYINIFRDRINIVTTNSKVNIDTKEILDSTTEYKEQGKGYIGITSYDDFILFNIYKKENDDIIPINLNLYGDIYLNFKDKDEIKIRQYDKVDQIQNNQRMFKIAKEDAKKILGFKNDNFYITGLIKTDAEESNESLIYLGKWYAYDQFLVK